MKILSVIACALASLALQMPGASAACSDLAVRVATTPIPPQYPVAVGHQDELLKHVPRRADILIIGDSLMAAWEPDSIARTFPGRSVWNYAVGGDKTQTMLWRTSRLAAFDLYVRSIVVLAGTNNLTDPDMPACAVAIGVETLVTRAHAIWPDAAVNVMTVAPRGENFAFRNDDRQEINDLLGDWTSRTDYARLVRLPERELTCAGVDKVCPNYARDLLHFEPRAYDVIGRALRTQMKF